MNDKFITIIANNLDEAISKASAYTRIPEDKLKYEILEKRDKIKVKIILDGNKTTTDEIDYTQSVNGYFKIRYKEGYATLAVFPPINGGREVYIEDIIKRIKLLNIPKIDYELIKRVIEESKGKHEIISQWPNGNEFRPDIELKISDDRIRAYIKVITPKNSIAKPTKEDILFELDTNNVKYGINEDTVNDIIENKKYDEYIEVATGLIPIDEKNKYIKPLFDTTPGKPFLLDNNDKINLKELNFIQNKFKGEIIAEIYPGEEGLNGIDVFGEIIPCPKDLTPTINYGDNIKLSDDGLTLFTMIDCNCFIKNNTINVEPIKIIDNIDYKTGNIDFIGAVVINQTILDGFTIRAKGSIQIGQSIGKVYIESEKDIILKAGINGNSEGTIICKGDLYAKFIEGANIICNGNVFVEEAIMNSNLKADKNVVLLGKRAEIIGGNIIVGGNLRCKKFGNVSNTKTTAFIGIIPEKFELIEELKKKINKLYEKEIEIDSNIQRLEKTKKTTPELIDKINVAYNRLLINRERIKEELNDMEREYKEANYLLIPQNECMTIIESILYPNTVINFGKEEYKSSDRETPKIILRYSNGKIKTQGFNYKDIPEFKY